MEMAAVSVFLFVLFAFYQPALLLPKEEEEAVREFLKLCPPFSCGKLGEISFPFTNKTEDAACGPFVVKDCDKMYRQIKLDRGSDKWYQLENSNPWGSISITDTELQSFLKHKNCSSFDTDLILPKAQHVQFEITSILTPLVKCNHTVNTTSCSFDSDYAKCPNFNVSYSDLDKQLPSSHCSIIRLPKSTSNDHSDIFERLTAAFTLPFTVLPEFYTCNQCELKAGICHPNEPEPWCLYPNGTSTPITPPSNHEEETKKESANKLKLGIGFGCGAASAILVFLILFWYRHNRKKVSSNFLGQKPCSSAISKSDLEGANIFFGISIFSHSELGEATNNFASENELGDGGFGTVYYGKLRDGREVAVKRLYERNYRKVNQFLNEIEILAKLRHQNLVSLYGCTSRYSRELLLVYEYIPNGTVADHLHGNQTKSSPLNWPIRLRIAIETASALVYLHASDIIHRDVKTNNILLDINFCVKVADFGLSRLFPNDVTHVSTAPQGTPGYVDPEYFNCYQLTEKSDVYSFGVVLAELLSSMPAVDVTRARHDINLANFALNRIQKCAFDELIDPFLGHQTDEEVKRMTTMVAELAFLCLQQDKEMRPGMEEVLEELKRIESGEYESDTVDDDEEEHRIHDYPKSF